MHFLVKVMLFSAENTIFLYSPGRHALFRGQDTAFHGVRPFTKLSELYQNTATERPHMNKGDNWEDCPAPFDQ